jgi:hypothetical protein
MWGARPWLTLLVLVGCGQAEEGTRAPDDQADRHESLGEGKDISWLYGQNPVTFGKMGFRLKEIENDDGATCSYSFKNGDRDINPEGIHVYTLPALKPYDRLQVVSTGGFPAVVCTNGKQTQGCGRVDPLPGDAGPIWEASLVSDDIAGNWKNAQWIVVTSEATFRAGHVVPVDADPAHPSDYPCRDDIHCFSSYFIAGTLVIKRLTPGFHCPTDPYSI